MAETTDNAQITDEVRRRAADYARLAAERFAATPFEAVDGQLAEDWSKQPGQQTQWAAVRGIVQEAWNRRTEFEADSTASQAGFSQPPTFADAGNAVPRNLDEPNR